MADVAALSASDDGKRGQTMATNYTTKYASRIEERFHIASVTDSACGHDYDFVGAKTIKVYSVDTVALNDFDREAAGNRFGAVKNLGDSVQEMTCTQDKGFTFAIDAGDRSDQAIDKAAGKALRRELDEVVVPTMDKYRLDAWAKGAGSVVEMASLTKNTVVDAILDLNAMLTDALVPAAGRTLFLPTSTYKLLKQNPDFISVEALGKKLLTRGEVGEVDGCIVKPVPTSWMPAGVHFLVKYKNCTVDPVKLHNYDVLPKVQGFDGPVVQGRVYYDAFVLDTKKAGVGVCKVGSGA